MTTDTEARTWEPLPTGVYVKTVIAETPGAMLDKLNELLPPPSYGWWVSIVRNSRGHYGLNLWKPKPE